MDTSHRSWITADALHGLLGTAAAPRVIDMRPRIDDAGGRAIPASVRADADDVERWAALLHAGERIVACGEDDDTGERISLRLRALGFDAVALAGGMAAWLAAGRPTMDATRGLRRIDQKPSCWVTRARPKIDRIACPWLVRRFVDREATILYVPASEVKETAARVGGEPFDIPGVSFGHVGDLCSFDAFIAAFGLDDPALRRLAVVVRGADTGRPELSPQSPGLLAMSHGLSALYADDQNMLRHGLVMYDALYAWQRATLTPGKA